MNRKFLSALLMGTLMVGSTGTFVSCKDYDDDIENLQNQIDKANVTLAELQALISSGSVIKSVTSTDKGLSFLLSDGKTYELTNGKDGANGTNGTNGVAWTIGEDGFWYKDDVKTEFKAIGVDGEKGEQGAPGTPGEPGAPGAPGEPGAAGKDGKYYVPNPETGFFDIYLNGELVEETTIQWKVSEEGGITAILSGNTLTLHGVVGAPETGVTILLGKQLGSVAFIPEVMSSVVSYPTTTDLFYHVASYLDETKFDATTKEFETQAWNKSNAVSMIYRLNPTDAYVEDAIGGFINRAVTTRAAGDEMDLLTVKDMEIENGVATVNALINHKAMNATGTKKDIAALQLWVGQTPVTSDYVHVASNPIDVVLVDTTAATAETPSIKEFYTRGTSFGTKEDDTYIKTIVGLDAAHNLSFVYNDSIDLKKCVGLYSMDEAKFLAKLGFTDMTYKFSLPAEYLATDAQNTNQQWYVELNDGELKANKNNLVNGLTPAQGRTPVVRVDAYLTSNDGVEQMVASAYIKLKITEVAETPGEEAKPIEAEISAMKAYEYHSLKAAPMSTVAGEMDWRAVNNILYGKTGLTSQTFWNNYGGADKTYEIKVVTTKQDGTAHTVFTKAAAVGDVVVESQDGFDFEVKLYEGETQTSNIKIGVNNKLKTENSYKDIDNKGAKYVVTLTIKSNNLTRRGDIVLTQEVYAIEDCTSFTYNPLYYHSSYEGTPNCILVKGQLVNDAWRMSSKVSEHFAKKEGKDIFDYYNTINNVTALSFKWNAGTEGVSPDVDAVQTDDFTVALNGAMTEAKAVKNMTYKTMLANGEDCEFAYNIVFRNPFIKGISNEVKVYGNGIGENVGETAPQVSVIDVDQDPIYVFNAETNALALTKKATDGYKVSTPTVVYAFDKDNDDYKEVIDNMSPGSDLDVDTVTGKFIWKNEGSTLKRDYKLSVIATVTFADLSEVQCVIPVTLTANR